MLLVVNNGSIYTKYLINFLDTQKTIHETHPFEKITLEELSKFSSIILSGRRQNNSSMNALNSRIIKFAIAKEKPLLGICYGAEILALTIGGTISKMDVPNNGMQEIVTIKDNPLCEGKIKVFESHSYLISKIDKSIIQIAKSNICPLEIIQIKNLNIFGTQFHPEMSDDGKILLKKFLKI